jgi:hypothetical protein
MAGFLWTGPVRESTSDVSQRKLCIVATDQTALIELLYELSLRDDCYFVKYSTKPKDGMYLGRCFLTTDAAAGKLWSELKVHPKSMCTIQDDDFTESFRQIDESI